jgi:hypothetical protein
MECGRFYKSVSCDLKVLASRKPLNLVFPTENELNTTNSPISVMPTLDQKHAPSARWVARTD